MGDQPGSWVAEHFFILLLCLLLLLLCHVLLTTQHRHMPPFRFCPLCRRNHNHGRKHNYSKSHLAAAKHMLGTVAQLTQRLRGLVHAPESGSKESWSKREWCTFCGHFIPQADSDDSDGDGSGQAQFYGYLLCCGCARVSPLFCM